MARFYALRAEHDLFGYVVLVRAWDRIGTVGRAQRDQHTGDAHPLLTGARPAPPKADRRRRRQLRSPPRRARLGHFGSKASGITLRWEPRTSHHFKRLASEVARLEPCLHPGHLALLFADDVVDPCPRLLGLAVLTPLEADEGAYARVPSSYPSSCPRSMSCAGVGCDPQDVPRPTTRSVGPHPDFISAEPAIHGAAEADPSL